MWTAIFVIALLVVGAAIFATHRGNSDSQDSPSPISGNVGKDSLDDILMGRNNPPSNEAAFVDDLVSVPPSNQQLGASSSQTETSKEWTGLRSPEEEYMSMVEGDKERTLLEFEDGFGNLSTKERRDIDAPEPCGFRFKNVIVNTSDLVDLETGEIGDSAPFITPDLNNFGKMANDWRGLKRFLRFVGDQVPQFPASKVLFYIDNIKFLPVRNADVYQNEALRNHDYTAYIVIEPLTKTGRTKKFPIRTLIDITWHEEFDNWYGKKDQPGRETITFRAGYLKDGTIGKGEIILWENKEAYILDFALDKDEGYYIKKIKTNTGPSLDEWSVLYPSE